MSLGESNKNLLVIFALMSLLTVHSMMFKYIENRGQTKRDGQVLQATDSVQVSGVVYGCILNVKARPEKRVLLPNWGTQLTVDVYKSGSFIGTALTQTDNQGEASVDLCAAGLTEFGGTYDFKVRGLSHLYMEYEDEPALYTAESDIDFSESETISLFAGETSNIFDNYINSLDLSTQIVHLYSDDNKNDLNQDKDVNSLDISNTIWNFYMNGD